jgi:hypothetical protein
MASVRILMKLLWYLTCTDSQSCWAGGQDSYSESYGVGVGFTFSSDEVTCYLFYLIDKKELIVDKKNTLAKRELDKCE